MNTLKNIRVPRHSDNLESVIDYLIKQNEALNVMLSNLGTDNLNKELRNKLTGGAENETTESAIHE